MFNLQKSISLETVGADDEDADGNQDDKNNVNCKKFELLARRVASDVIRNATPTSIIIGDRVMYARSQQRIQRPDVTGGVPITLELATALRVIVFGGCATPARGEWLRTGLVFIEGGKNMSYGLKAPRNSTRGLLSALQSYLLKHFLFEKTSTIQPDEALKPDRCKQVEALWRSICDIIWKVGEGKKAIICLPQDKSHVQHSLTYFQDTITEKFQDEPGPGALLLLYSALLTRGVARVKNDLDGKSNLLMTSEEGSHCVPMLLLTGRATSYLHNGVIYMGDEEHYALPQFGVLARSEIGFLLYEDDSRERLPGSRLKTPSLPIWVVSCQGHFGVIFNTNRDLLRNYHAERRFELIYYTCGGNQLSLTVDTRNNVGMSSESEDAPSTLMTNLEKLIHTKY